MVYTLKENNNFYGKAGIKIPKEIYNRLPDKHKLLFEKQEKKPNPLDELGKIQSSLQQIIRDRDNNRVPRPADNREDGLARELWEAAFNNIENAEPEEIEEDDDDFDIDPWDDIDEDEDEVF